MTGEVLLSRDVEMDEGMSVVLRTMKILYVVIHQHNIYANYEVYLGTWVGKKRTYFCFAHQVI